MIEKEECEYFTEYVKKNTETGDRWYGADEIDSWNFHDSYPHVNKQSGTVIIYEWGHEAREESVSLGLTVREDTPFGVDVDAAHGMYHAHGADTLKEGMQTVSVCTFMLNHSATARSKEFEMEGLKDTIDGLQKQLGDIIETKDKIKRKNEMLRSQMNTLVETLSCGYDEGDWHGIISKPQSWRPPTHEETRRLALHIDRYWYNQDPESLADIRDGTRNEIENAHIIILEDWRSVVPGAEDKLLFFQDKVDGLFGVYLFNEDGEGLKEVQQRPEMLSDDPQGEIVVRFGNTS